MIYLWEGIFRGLKLQTLLTFKESNLLFLGL